MNDNERKTRKIGRLIFDKVGDMLFFLSRISTRS